MPVRYATEFGLAGDGVANDTSALNVALAALGLGDVLLLMPGATYLVDADSVTYPDLTSGAEPTWVVGPATIKARTTGHFLFATGAYADGRDDAGSPWVFDGVTFDGDGKVEHSFVLRAYASHFITCTFKGATLDTFLFTRENTDGETANLFLSNCKWRFCHFSGIEGGGTSNSVFKTTSSTGQGPADGWMIGCHLAANGADYAMDILNTGGWHITENHLWEAAVANCRIRNLWKGGTISNNTWGSGDGLSVLVDRISENRAGRLGPGNTYWGDLKVGFTDDDVDEMLYVVGEWFSHRDDNATTTTIIHDSNRLNKRIIVGACSFRSPTPYVENHENSQIIDVGGNWAGGTGTEALLPVRRADLATTGTAAVVTNGGRLEVNRTSSTWLGRMQSDQPASYFQFICTAPSAGSDIFQHRFGDGDAGYVQRAAHALDTTVGAQSGAIIERVRTSGTLNEEARIANGVQFGLPTGGAKGVGSLNTTGGTYRQGVPGLFSAGTKVTAAAPYTNDGYITVTLADGTTVKVMTTA